MLLSLIMSLAPFATEASRASDLFPLTRPRNSNNAKARYISRVMAKARRLEGDENNNNAEEDEYMPDLSKYSLVFEKCQFMRYYAGEVDENTGSVLATGSFAIFKLCPSCNSCNYNYGEYMVNLDDYLVYTTEYYQEQQEEECEWCEQSCYYDNYYEGAEVEEADNEAEQADQADQEDQQGDQEEQQEDKEGEEEGGEEAEGEGEGEGEEGEGQEGEGNERRRLANNDCDTCKSNCYKWNNMEANGYVQATNFLGCVELYEDYYGNMFYAGAMCGNSDGNKIKIGVFKDANCGVPTDLDIETYVNLAAEKERRGRELEDNAANGNNGNGIKVSHSILKHVYSSGNCISCAVQDEQEDEEGYYEGDQNNNEILDVCENIYNEAAKCESAHGFDDNQHLSSNQQAQEKTVCNLINQLKRGTYDAISGEIELQGKSKKFSSVKATGGQKFALTVFILATCTLAVYSAILHQKLVKGGGGRLNAARGAMA